MTILSIFLIVQWLILWAVLAITPFLLPSSEAFGINLPDTEEVKRIVKRLNKNYFFIMLVSGVAIFPILVSAIMKAEDALLFNTYILSFTLTLVFAAIAYYINHSKLKKTKEQRNWAQVLPQVAMTMPEIKKNLVSPWYFLLYLPVIALTLIIPSVFWDRIPDSVPLRYDIQGNPVIFIEKGIGFLLWPVLMQGFICLIMGFVYLSMRFTRVRLDPSNPKLSAQQQSVFRKRWSIFTVFGGLALCLLFMMFPLSAAFSLGPSVQFVIIFTWTIGIVLWAIILSINTGQLGSRITSKQSGIKKAAQMPDEDKYWKAGVFYYNPDDPSVFVEKRFGVGFTLNWGSKLAWLILAGFIIVLTSFIIVVNILTA
ncbi:DUF5808 domain-containing protein [Spirochaetia bacterium 38H-sp]|uniref:DUF5808 domain-containing protein n=1 Tax=Rarispira pelagica TaxID=3141764 RepID=A0ABU9U9I4_9SPIR